jgi:tetratricopeptide (TPR) repeat protein
MASPAALPPGRAAAGGIGGARRGAGALGLVLWQSVRDATLWALTPAEKRQGLFTPDAEPRRLADVLTMGAGAAAIDDPLQALAGMLSHPADIAPEAVMLACDRVSVWAEARGSIATAIAFAQASALALPGSARSALRVGRLARRAGDNSRAEGWLQRTVVLARQEGDSVSHAWAYTALGRLHMLRGNSPAAERHHQRALRIAERHSLRARAAAALHDLFALCAQSGRIPEAVAYARRAVTAYGPKHDRLATLAHDVALLWLESGEFARALPVLQASIPRMSPNQQVLGLASTARAAGSLGEPETFTRCQLSVASIVDAGGERENHPAALLNVGWGASALGDLDLAAGFAARARALATELAQHRIVFAAECLLDSVEASRRAAGVPAAQAEVIAPADRETIPQADELAGELLAGLAG